MIQSAAYEIIKQEGIQQGMLQEQFRSRRNAIGDVLEVRLGLVPLDVIQKLKAIKDIQVLDELHRKAVIVQDMHEFRTIMKQILEPA